LQERPAAVVVEVIAALDEWASQRRIEKRPQAAKHLANLAAILSGAFLLGGQFGVAPCLSG
jgi:hypothetical protein